ncbi:50S ribosomal protein L4 [Candidatus Shapirobacteria bacterium CG10_big_fil_rev_8_21_14_0_10_38_14]|uniref:Large ribosomal subunit protein uL4 n=1 Tax=Candidatus Shapirobacteria bacterium CG10_big_fil_rev_8_21_14_0_10_38_14 TaxID=1974483 RepID=A0A2M8L5T6_9BACT|nr:MAG: 50S ribosomal protein L4 [Candidatus Shapirobacteria bacterium CG10_big_fil_rev_8_21_14_0_10_38_14]
MAKLDLFSLDGKKAGQVALSDKVFAAKINPSLMSQAVRVYLANQRKAKVKVKNRGEVSGSGKKIWRQKGTGRARHGDRYAPIFVGGGVAHGPRGNRNYKLKMAKKMKKASLFSALTSKLKAKEILVIEGLVKIKPKTKEIVKIIHNLQLDNLKILLVMPEKLDNVWQAGRNIENLNLIQVDLLNTYQVLDADKIILMKEAVEKLRENGIK